MTEVLTVTADSDEEAREAVRRRVAAIVDEGRLAVVPTDTAYGVLVNPFHPHGADRLYSARGGDRRHPLPVFVHSPRQLPAFAEVSEEARRLMAACWPGPLTLLFEAVESMEWDLGEGEGTVGVRMPDDAFLLEILGLTGPLGCTAAVRAGEPAPTTVEEALTGLGDAVALYVDGGPRTATPSTVVDVSRGGAEVRRAGAVSADRVFTVANGLDEPSPEPSAPEPSAPEPSAPESSAQDPVEPSAEDDR
jgi:tRNA threonylcarbamoyl adenosine modification protein (Sua5/YciO/YrdC/YwlC family)